MKFVSAKGAWRGACAEFFGTLMYVFVVAGTWASGSFYYIDEERTTGRLLSLSLAQGLGYTVFLYSVHHISGGHLNPAVTVANMIARRVEPHVGLYYIIAQLLGAMGGAALVKGTCVNPGRNMCTTIAGEANVGHAFFIEFICTFILIFTILATIEASRQLGRLVPLTIGFCLTVCTLMAGPFTGASLNPARSFGPAVVARVWDDQWVYWAGPLLGAACAASVHVMFFRIRRVAA